MIAQIFCVALGGAIGAVFRYVLGMGATSLFGDSFPWGTLIANTLGCFLMGVLVGLALQKNNEPMWLFLGIGGLGALTTFSTFSADTFNLLNSGHWTLVAFNIAGTMTVTLAAFFGGMVLTKWLTNA